MHIAASIYDVIIWGGLVVMLQIMTVLTKTKSSYLTVSRTLHCELLLLI